MSQQKKTMTPEVIAEWDVVRRTAEFFDSSLNNLRTFGLTASVTIIGVAFEFKVYPLFLAIALLDIALIFIDKRSLSYLKATSKYASKLEVAYTFAISDPEGLTHAIDTESAKQGITKPDNLFLFLYVVITLSSVWLFLSLSGIVLPTSLHL